VSATMLSAHPAADLFPLLSDADLSDLASDIAENGLLEPIVLHEGLVLDGRNRLAACEQAGVDPRFVEWNGDGGTPLRYVLSHNLHRRHLTTSQRAAIAVDVLPMFEEEARKRQLSGLKQGDSAPVVADRPERETTRARDEAAALMNVGARTVGRAKQIKEASPEVFEQIKRGETTVEAAHKAAGLNGSTRINKPEPEPAEEEAPVRADTIEAKVRRGMALEAEGYAATDVGPEVGISANNYRRARYIVMLADEPDLSASDRIVVRNARARMNQHSEIAHPFAMVEQIVARKWGSTRGISPDRAAQNRMDNFERAYGALTYACASVGAIEIPLLSPDRAREICDELKAASRHVDSLRRRIEEATR
jgi:hypothetical protein